MEINLNAQAHTPYEMFNITDERSNFLLDHIAEVCAKAYEGFPNEYSAHIDIENKDRLDIARILTEMLAPAANEDEKNYVLYVSHSGIGRVFDLITMFSNI